MELVSRIQELTLPFGSKPGKKKAPLDEAGLLNYAVSSLGRAMRSEADLRRLMLARVEADANGEALVTRVVARLKDYGYLNDATFAETYARLRQENEKFGQRRVQQDLYRKGIKPALIDQTLEARYGKIDEEALARQHLERKRLAKPTNEKETARIVRRLVGAGFSTGVIFKILRQWDVPEEALGGLESIGEEHEEM
jgi:regulatory protein